MSSSASGRVVGFVGLGAMGLPMCRNLLASGFSVRGFDLREAARQSLADAGGHAAVSVADAAAGADTLVLMVINIAQAEAALIDLQGLEALRPGGHIVLMSTCPPSAVEKLAARVTAAGRQFVDAPVSGGMAGAIAGTLTIMAAAPSQVLEEVRDILSAVGNKVVHVGLRAGQGAMVKTVNQLVCGVHIAVIAEALSLSGKVGIDPDVILDVLGGSAASSWMLHDRGPRMTQGSPKVTSAVDIFVKDLNIVLEAGRETKAALPLAAVAHQIFLATSGRGDGSADDSQIIRTYRALNGIGTPADG